ncbi:MAG: efflux RND transporter periplasmic adaptor subunit [Thiobacillus sp.]|uniref:efflux RND transporter periplasmic adaptor subunit n=1 Tax=Thiobacillus sp. TaxID=924 RepID=UPI0027354510|nr:efflux RND transporter periplasmic adaptor subunit [Thiobacillus sp.]MDP3585995.1 efflux RND transporter periplasmic adaptor subunit [Thiobacillus sp.]
MKTRILLAVVVLALVAGVVYRTQFESADGPAGGGGGAIEVKTVAVDVSDFPLVIELPGTLEAARQVDILAQVGGSLIKQHVQEGDAVRAGQVLFTLDARPAQARMAQSQAARAGARAETAEAEQKLERLAPLMQSGYISRQEYDEARVAFESARARVGTTTAELEVARLDAQYAQIRAPIDGRVGRINVRAGALVQAGGEALTTIVAPGALDVRAWLPEVDWAAVVAARAAGKIAAEIHSDALTQADRGTPLAQGELVFIDAQVDPATGAVPIKVRMQDRPVALLSGQGVHLRLLLGKASGSKVLPEATLQHGQQGTYVYVVRDGVAAVQPVTVKHRLDGMLAIEGELAAGERVLLEIPKRLKAGGKVRLEGEQPAGKQGADKRAQP